MVAEAYCQGLSCYKRVPLVEQPLVAVSLLGSIGLLSLGQLVTVDQLALLQSEDTPVIWLALHLRRLTVEHNSTIPWTREPAYQ
jgi:hypothetical protein